MKNQKDEKDLKLKLSFCPFAFVKLVWFPFLVLVGIYASYLGLIPLKSGIHTVVLITLIFVIFLFFVSHNGISLYCRFKNNSEHIKQKVENFLHVNAFEVNGINKAVGDIEPIFSEYYSLLRNENYSSVAAMVFPTLGILGTFISIAISMPDFGSSTSEALEHEISLLLSGVGTAFYVSIYGIFLSLWWMFFEKRGLSLFELSVNKIIQDNRHNIWTQYELDHAKYIESHRLQREMLSTLTLFRADEYVAGMDKLIRERFDTFEKFVKAESEIVKQSDIKMQRSVEAISSAQKSDELMLQNYENISKSIKDVNTQISTNNAALNELLSFSNKKEIKLNDTILDITKVLEETLGSIKDQNEQFVAQKREMLKTFAQMIQGNSDFTNLFTSQYKELLEVLSDIKDTQEAK
jgi:hypothetical protein